ncbi:MAG: hypothetical protein ABEI06_03910 [Halobacteriaceae archaeon]
MNTVLGLGGLWIATFGLIGVYPHLDDHGRRAQGGVLTGTGAWLLLTVAVIWALVRNITGTAGEGSGTTLLVVPGLILALLSFLLYGVLSLQSGKPSRTIGYLFLVPFVAVLLLILIFFGTNLYNMEFPVLLGVVLFGVMAISIIGLGTKQPRETSGQPSPSG